MSEAIKIFSKVYVAHRKQHQNEEDPPLAFLTPYEENAAGRKRIESADKWARDYNKEAIETKIFDNESLDGFEICREVKRTYWGGGNVVWRIFDPRGFELEISSANLAKILTFATIEAGVIKSKCIWGRLGAKNILIPEGCPDYQNVKIRAEELNDSKIMASRIIKPSDIAIGQSVILHNDERGVYLGKWFILTDSKYSNYKAQGAKIADTIIPRHVVKVEKEYYAIAELKVIGVAKCPATPYDIDKLEATLNRIDAFQTFGTAGSIKNRLTSRTKFEVKDVKREIRASKEILSKVQMVAKGYSNIFHGNYPNEIFQKKNTKISVNKGTSWTSPFLFGKTKNGKYFFPIIFHNNRHNYEKQHKWEIDFPEFNPEAEILNVNQNLMPGIRNGAQISFLNTGLYHGAYITGLMDLLRNFLDNDVEDFYTMHLYLERDGAIVSNELYSL